MWKIKKYINGLDNTASRKKHAEDFVVATLKMVEKYYWKMIRK